jgi:hypothetical protein
LIFKYILDYDRKSMFDVIVANLKAGVSYRYILCGDTLIAKDWELFIRALKHVGVTQLPQAVCESSHLAPMILSTAAVYEYEDPNHGPEAISILQHVPGSNACVVLSPQVSRQVRDAFWRIWNELAEVSGRRLPA